MTQVVLGFVGGGLVFLLVGGLVLTAGWRMERRYTRMMRTGVPVQARVVDKERRVTHSTESTSVTYARVVWFRTLEGQDIRAVSRTSTNRIKPRVGDVIGIHYDPAAPASVVLDGYEGGCAPGLLIAVGVIFALTGLMVIGVTLALA